MSFTAMFPSSNTGLCADCGGCNISFAMHEFLTGAGLWIAGSVCLGGLAARLSLLLVLSRRKDKILYNHVNLGWGFKSIGRWLIPWSSASMRMQPFFTFIGFTFHFTLLAIPLFLRAHNMLWERAFGVGLPSMSNYLADVLTVVFFLCSIVLLSRRALRPEVRILTGIWDYALLLFILLPFITGFMAFHQIGDYDSMLQLHMFSAEFLLILIPTTKLSHGLLFFITRAFIGFELGTRRGARAW